MNISHFETMRRVRHIGKAASVALLFTMLLGGIVAFSSVAYAQQNATMGTVLVSTATPTINAYVNQPLTIGFGATGGQSYNGTECVVTGGPSYGWSASGGTVIPPANTASCSVSASFSSPGTHTVTASCTMGYTTNNCGNLSGTGSRSVTVNVTAATVVLQSVNWGGTRYAVSKDDGTYASNGTGSEPTPDYTTSGNASPVCFNSSSTPSCSATFLVTNCVGSEPATFTMSGSAGAGGSLSSTPVSATLTNGTVTVSFSPTGSFSSAIDNSTLSASFSVSVAGASATSAGSSSNPLYVVLGSPEGLVTNTRMNRVTSDCKGTSTAGGVVVGVWGQEIKGLEVGPNAGAGWGNLDPSGTGECIDIINCMSYAIAMTGVGAPGTTVLVYPALSGLATTGGSTTRACNPPNSNHNFSTASHSAYSNTETLEYADSASQGNLFEACYYYGGLYYPGGGDDTCTSLINVLHAFANGGFYYYADEAEVNGFSTNAQEPCLSPGPNPASSW